MLIRLTGAVLLIVAGAGAGLYRGMESRFRAGDLRDIRRGLRLMYSETEFGRSMLAPMCHRAGEYCHGGMGRLFTAFARELEEGRDSPGAMWRLCLDRLEGTHLAHEDRERLGALGEALGGEDVALQLSALEQAMDYIDEKESELAAVGEREMRLYPSCGLLTGLLGVILLL